MSVTPPGAKAATRTIGLEGYGASACAAPMTMHNAKNRRMNDKATSKVMASACTRERMQRNGCQDSGAVVRRYEALALADLSASARSAAFAAMTLLRRLIRSR